MKKKVLIFIQDGVGGAERMTVLIGKSLDKNLFDVRFCLIESAVNSSILDFIPHDLSVYKIKYISTLGLVFAIISLIIKEKPSIVFSSVFNLSNKYLPFMWLFPKTRAIIRCDNYLYTYNEKQQRVIRKLYPKADCIIAQTKEMKDELIDIGIEKEKIIVLQNPIDIDTIKQKLLNIRNPFKCDGCKHLVAVGRFNEQKGFDLLIDSFIKVKKVLTDIDLTIVGDYTAGGGRLYEEISRLIMNEGISDSVMCVGYQDNPYIYIKNADCFVLSSRYEGLPNVLIEALFLGTPVAAFKCIPIIERIVEDGRNGYCAEKEDTESLAHAILKALQLTKIETSYKPANIDEFTALFDQKYYNSNILYKLGDGKILTRRHLKKWIQADYEAFEMEHPIASRFSYGENWTLYSYLKNLRHLEYYINKQERHIVHRLMYFYYWFLFRRFHKKMGIYIAPNTVGPGCHLVHYGFRHITQCSRVGANSTILPMVLFGKKRTDVSNFHITIGDNCYISVGSTILGPITIGDNVTIAAGAVVNKDVSSNKTIAGVPAREIITRR